MKDGDSDYSRALAFRRASCVLKSLPFKVSSVNQLRDVKDVGAHSKRVINVCNLLKLSLFLLIVLCDCKKLCSHIMGCVYRYCQFLYVFSQWRKFYLTDSSEIVTQFLAQNTGSNWYLWINLYLFLSKWLKGAKHVFAHITVPQPIRNVMCFNIAISTCCICFMLPPSVGLYFFLRTLIF